MNRDIVRISEIVSRRRLLKRAGAGVAAATLSTTVGSAPAAERTGRTPISLIIDDGAPVDPLFYELPGYETPLLVPREFTQRVVESFDRFDLRGKFTVIPMPSCLGRVDQTLKRVPPEHLANWLKLVREGIAPRFDITPEFLTHLKAYNFKSGDFQHIYEDIWISKAPPEEIVEYFVLAFQILKNVGLPATGITSPWVSGIDVEKKYTQALADAQWKVFERKLIWYFLHCTEWNAPRRCSIEYEDKTRGQTVVSVPANTGDIFWTTHLSTRAEKQEFIRKGIDRMISADGRTGRIRQLMESGYPVVLVTHWQSLYTQGTGLGLEGLNALAERIQKVFGKNLEWVMCSELARRYVETARPKA
jgi:hypothetical protein